MNLKKLYNSYYINPKKNWHPLFQNLQNYNFEGFENLTQQVLSLKIDNIINSVILFSNTRQPYNFAPNFCIENTEDILQNQIGIKKFLFIWDQFRRKNHMKNTSIKGSKTLYAFYTFNIWQNWQLIADFVKKCCSEQKLWIVGCAYSLNQMTLNEPFLNAVQHDIHGFINTDVPAFVNTTLLPKYNLQFNDQMINWKSGVNFYTCEKQNKHFLPIFAKKDGYYYNLLNLHRNGILFDDLFEITSPFYTCPCGKITCDFKFVPHYKNFLDDYHYDQLLEMRNKLFSKMRWIQFIQEKQNIKVYYETVENDIEKDIIECYLGNNISFHKGEFFQIGIKFPCFWKINTKKIHI